MLLTGSDSLRMKSDPAEALLVQWNRIQANKQTKKELNVFYLGNGENKIMTESNLNGRSSPYIRDLWESFNQSQLGILPNSNFLLIVVVVVVVQIEWDAERIESLESVEAIMQIVPLIR